MITRYTLNNDVRGPDYIRTLHLATAWCPYALFVVRPRPALDSRGDSVLEILQGSLVDSYEATEWPGTRLLVGSARVYVVKLDVAVDILARVAGGFFDWRQPSLPEDLSLLREAREPCLVTISHEKDGYLDLTDSEFATLEEELPTVVARLRPEGPPPP